MVISILIAVKLKGIQIVSIIDLILSFIFHTIYYTLQRQTLRYSRDHSVGPDIVKHSLVSALYDKRGIFTCSSLMWISMYPLKFLGS